MSIDLIHTCLTLLIMAKTQFHMGRNKISNIKKKLLKHNMYPEVTYWTTTTIKSKGHIKTSKYF